MLALKVVEIFLSTSSEHFHGNRMLKWEKDLKIDQSDFRCPDIS